MDKYCIVVAGGKGVRMGADVPKQFIPLQGMPILMRTIYRLHQSVPEAKFVLVLPREHIVLWEELVRRYSFDVPVRIAYGGDTRFQSVKNALSLIEDEEALVAVHDGVRPFVDETVVKMCFEVAENEGTAIPAISSVESVRIKNSCGATVPFNRDKIYLVQTPQTFRLKLLRKAYQQKFQPGFTDDASVVETLPEKITLVQGNRENIKITTPFDLKVAEAFLG